MLPLLAESVGPSGRVVGIDREARLLASARAHTAAYPWVELVEADGPTGTPTVICYPPFPGLERLGSAYITSSLRRGSDSQAGRKLLDRFRQAGLADLRIDAQAAFVSLADPRTGTMLDLFARGGAGREAEELGVFGYTSWAIWALCSNLRPR